MSFLKSKNESGSYLANSAWRLGAAAVLACASLGAQAQLQTVFNAYQDINGDFISPQADAYNCFTCIGQPSLSEIGDIVTLGGTSRIADSALVMVGQFGVPGVAFTPYVAQVTLSFYNVSNIGPTPTVSLIGSQTNNYNITANNSIFDLPFNFTGSGITLPDTLYYGVSVASSSPLVAGLRLGFFDYLAPLNSGAGLVNVPAGTLQAGIDVGTTVTSTSPLAVSSFMYARTLANPSAVVQTVPGVVGGPSINTGFTPAVFITAVPEPETYALMLLGLAAVAGFAAKRKREQAA